MKQNQQDGKLAHQALNICQQWGVDDATVVSLLGLDGVIKARHLDRYKKGEALPSNDLSKAHIDHIIGIDDALSTTYPTNRQMARMWLNRPHRRFAKQTPMQKMLNDGQQGLLAVRMDVDCTFGCNR